MTTSRLQSSIDLVRSTSRQRWRLGLAAVVSVMVAAIVAGFAIGPFLILLVTLPAVFAAVRPGSPAALATIAVVAAEWLGSADEAASPGSIVVAIGLFGFHAAISLLAVTPHSARVDAHVIRRWTQRSAAVTIATTFVWAMVAAMDRRQPPASSVLLFLALGSLAAATWLARRPEPADDGAGGPTG